MTTCARCGQYLTNEKWSECGDEDTQYSESGYTLACRDRQIAAQAALLRSVTGKLEGALEHLSDAESSVSVAKAEMCITAVLEALS